MLQRLNIDLPTSLTAICQRYDTEVSISRVVQSTSAEGYGEDEEWSLTLCIISQICRHCGEIRHRVGQIPEQEKCLRHSWVKKQPIRIVDASGDTIDHTIVQAEAKAASFLRSPEKARWKVTLYLDRNEYLAYQQTLSESVREFITLYDELGLDERKVLLKFMQTLVDSDKGHVVGGE